MLNLPVVTAHRPRRTAPRKPNGGDRVGPRPPGRDDVGARTGPRAAADDKLPIGGGAGIVINGDTFCTLTTIGTDKTGALVGLTSAHCGGPGAQVASEDAQDRGVIGTMVAGNDNLDYAVIRSDPAKVTPSRTGRASSSTASVPIRCWGRSPAASSAARRGTRAASPGAGPGPRNHRESGSAGNRATPGRP